MVEGPRCSPETLEPLGEHLDASHALATSRGACGADACHAAIRPVAGRALRADRRPSHPVPCARRDGRVHVWALAGPPTWDELPIPAHVATHVERALPGYSGPVRVGSAARSPPRCRAPLVVPARRARRMDDGTRLADRAGSSISAPTTPWAQRSPTVARALTAQAGPGRAGARCRPRPPLNPATRNHPNKCRVYVTPVMTLNTAGSARLAGTWTREPGDGTSARAFLRGRILLVRSGTAIASAISRVSRRQLRERVRDRADALALQRDPELLDRRDRTSPTARADPGGRSPPRPRRPDGCSSPPAAGSTSRWPDRTEAAHGSHARPRPPAHAAARHRASGRGPPRPTAHPPGAAARWRSAWRSAARSPSPLDRFGRPRQIQPRLLRRLAPVRRHLLPRRPRRRTPTLRMSDPWLLGEHLLQVPPAHHPPAANPLGGEPLFVDPEPDRRGVQAEQFRDLRQCQLLLRISHRESSLALNHGGRVPCWDGRGGRQPRRK